MRHGIRSVLNSPADKEGERGENKTGATIFLYVVSPSSYVTYLRILGVLWQCER